MRFLTLFLLFNQRLFHLPKLQELDKVGSVTDVDELGTWQMTVIVQQGRQFAESATCKAILLLSAEQNPNQSRAFNDLKQRLAHAETLALFDTHASTSVIADASPVGLGAVLVQEQHGIHRVISYARGTLSNVERRYSQTEKEALALVWACERFSMYLIGRPFLLITDHKPLETIYGPKSKPSARIERWVLRLQSFDFSVKYRPGKHNIADPLSRLSVENTVPDGLQDDDYVKFVATSATPGAMTTRAIEEASFRDQELQQLRYALQHNTRTAAPRNIHRFGRN